MAIQPIYTWIYSIETINFTEITGNLSSTLQVPEQSPKKEKSSMPTSRIGSPLLNSGNFPILSKTTPTNKSFEKLASGIEESDNILPNWGECQSASLCNDYVGKQEVTIKGISRKALKHYICSNHINLVGLVEIQVKTHKINRIFNNLTSNKGGLHNH